MSENRATLEIIAPTIEEAVAKGLSDLGVPEEAVEVEILDQGSRGLFGLGSRQARVRLTIKAAPRGKGDTTFTAQPALTEPEQETAQLPAEESARVEFEPVVEPEPDVDVDEEDVEAVDAYLDADVDIDEDQQVVTRTPVAASLDDNFEIQVVRDTVQDLIEKMKVRATVTAYRGQADGERSRVPVMVEVRGDDLSILIGRRAETLNALQYIANLIVSKELGKQVSLVIDVQGYRSRREGQLRQLARRMAEQAVKTGRRQVLEPMPANERRIVHIELRDDPNVTTESVGEEPRRKVTIIPKE